MIRLKSKEQSLVLTDPVVLEGDGSIMYKLLIARVTSLSFALRRTLGGEKNRKTFFHTVAHGQNVNLELSTKKKTGLQPNFEVKYFIIRSQKAPEVQLPRFLEHSVITHHQKPY